MKAWIKPGIFIALLAAGAFFIHRGTLNTMFDQHALAASLHVHGWRVVPGWILAGALFTAIGGPRQMLAFAAGFIFGALPGALYSTLVTLLGCLITMAVSRSLLSDMILARYPRHVASLRNLFEWHGWLTIAMIRFFPVGSNVLTNLFAGTAHIGVFSMVVGSFIGYLPQMLIFSYAGAGMGASSTEQLFYSAMLFVVSSVLAVVLYRGQIQQHLQQWRDNNQESSRGG